MLLANSQHYYWLTAAHVLTNAGAAVQSLRVFPSDESRISLPFNEQYLASPGSSEVHDYQDLLALRIDLAEFDAFGDAPLVAQDAEVGLLAAEQLVAGCELWIIGYPAEKNIIDYEFAAIRNTRSVLRAVYRGVSTPDHCHTAKIESSIALHSYDGLSGSPVFYMHSIVQNAEEVVFPRIAGMLLRGTASSGLVHFVSAQIIAEVIRLASAKRVP